MTITSEANTTSLTRSLIGEATANFWTDAEVTLYINSAMATIGAKFFYILYPRYKTFADGAIVSGTDTVDLPDNCQKIGKVEVKSTKKQLRFIEEDEVAEFTNWGDGEPVAWSFKGGKIWLLPTPDFSDTDYLRIWYMEYMDAVTDFPEELRPLIAVEAAILARTKDEDVTPDLLALQKRLSDSAWDSLSITQIQEPAVARGFELASIYASQNEEE